jgi:putative membrane protein
MAGARVKDGWLWFSVLGGPVGWAVHLTASYPLVGFTCRVGSTFALQLVTAICLAAIAATFAVALACTRKLADAATIEASGAAHGRQSFMARAGVVLAVLFFLVTVAESLPLLFDHPCDDLRQAWADAPGRGAAALILATVTEKAAFAGPRAARGGPWTWSLDPVAVAAIVVTSAAYARGARVLRRRTGARGPAARRYVIASTGALTALALGLISPLDTLADTFFSAHMAQHLVLSLAAAPLFVFGRTFAVVPWALPRGARNPVLALSRASVRALGLDRPLVVLILYVTALWTWHVPALYEAALESELLHTLEHASFVGTSVALFAYVRSCHARASRSAGVGLLLVFAAATQGGVLGALITFSPAAWYGAHAERMEAATLSPLEDQQVAGLLMWIPGSVVFLGVALALGHAWLSAADRRVREKERARTRGRTAPVVGLLSLALAPGALLSCRAADEPLRADEAGRVTATGARGELVFEMHVSPARPAVGELFETVTTVRRRSTGEAVRGAQVTVDATMPQHGHGMTTVPVHIETGDGRYVTRGLKLHMPGEWTLEARAEGPRPDAARVVLTPRLVSAR